jgi:hypothetical protein
MTIFVYKWSRIEQFFQDGGDYVGVIVVSGESYFHGEVNWRL